jgi:signal transduction histidine kinase
VKRFDIEALLRAIAGSIALVIAIAFPLTTFLSGRHAETNLLAFESRVVAQDTTAFVSDAPVLWEVHVERIRDRLQNRLQAGRGVKLLDRTGNAITAVAVDVPSPTFTASSVVYDFGTPVATVVLSGSLRPLLIATFWTGLLGLGIAIVVYLPLRTISIRALRRSQRQLAQLNDELEQRVEDRTAALTVANKELESFSYSVSHDLRAPLRHIHGYAEMLTAATAGQLTDKAQRYLKTISDASVELGLLIDSLLAFSRMGRAELHETRVPLDVLVQDTIRGLEMATQGRNIEWKIAPLPLVLGDSTVLKAVFANLIGNAVKYSSKRDPAQIEIGCAGEEAERAILFVRDNGAGFDMRYVDKLFGVFQRLHTAAEFEGTGIGLAIVRRIISRHGGRTWAEGKLNEGATFYFTLRPAPPDPAPQ